MQGTFEILEGGGWTLTDSGQGGVNPCESFRTTPSIFSDKSPKNPNNYNTLHPYVRFHTFSDTLTTLMPTRQVAVSVIQRFDCFD